MSWNSLPEIANAMVEKGRGILAADESTPTCTKRFDSIGVESTEANRNAYRDMLFSTPGMEEFISGVILFDETLRQSTVKDNTPYPVYLTKLGVIPGIKVDKGAHPLPGSDGEKITEGLDGLDAKLKEYFNLGARFSKWRAVITIGESAPSSTCVAANAHALARYAALCQENGLVPLLNLKFLWMEATLLKTVLLLRKKCSTQLFMNCIVRMFYWREWCLNPIWFYLDMNVLK